MNFRQLVLANRSYRRFDQSVSIDKTTLLELVDLARQTASMRNAQPLRYALSWTPIRNQLIFPLLGWAGYLADWGGPKEGEQPTAYIILLGDRTVSQNYSIDPGIAAQTILLGAVEQGLGGCIIGSVNKPKLQEVLGISERYEPLYVLAIGKPAEKVVLEELPADGSIKYYRDAQGVHHVPKRSLKDVLVELNVAE